MLADPMYRRCIFLLTLLLISAIHVLAIPNNYGSNMVLKTSSGTTIFETIIPTMFLGPVNPTKFIDESMCFSAIEFEDLRLASHIDWQDSLLSSGWIIEISGYITLPISWDALDITGPEGANLTIHSFSPVSYTLPENVPFEGGGNHADSPTMIDSFVTTSGSPVFLSFSVNTNTAAPPCIMLAFRLSTYWISFKQGIVKDYTAGFQEGTVWESMFTVDSTASFFTPKVIAQFQSEEDGVAKISDLLDSLIGCNEDPYFNFYAKSNSELFSIPTHTDDADGSYNMNPCWYSGILCKLTINDIDDVEYEIIGLDLDGLHCSSSIGSFTTMMLFNALEYVPNLQILSANALSMSSEANENYYDILSVAGPSLEIFSCSNCRLSFEIITNFPGWFISNNLKRINLTSTYELSDFYAFASMSALNYPNLDSYFLNDKLIEWLENLPDDAVVDMENVIFVGYFPQSLETMLNEDRLMINTSLIWCDDDVTKLDAISILNCSDRSVTSISPPQIRPDLNNYTVTINMPAKSPAAHSCEVYCVRLTLFYYTDYEFDAEATPYTHCFDEATKGAYNITVDLIEISDTDISLDLSSFTLNQEIGLAIIETNWNLNGGDNTYTEPSGSSIVAGTCIRYYPFTIPASGVCPSGTQRQINEYDQYVCPSCEIGKYSSSQDASTCISCSNGAYTTSTGSNSISSCTCAIGSFGNASKGQDCTVCTRHSAIHCDQVNQEFPRVDTGYWYSTSSPNAVFLCIPFKACSGSTDQSTVDCAEGYTGDRCAFCVENEYFRLGGECKKCPEVSTGMIGLLFLLVIMGCGVVLVVSRPAPFKMSSIGIAFTWIQIISLFGSLPMQWPRSVSTMYSSASSLNFNVELFSPECSSPMSFKTKWFLKQSIPLFLCAVLTILYNIQTFLEKRGMFPFSMKLTVDRLIYGCTMIFIWTYTLLCATTFEPLNCVEDGGIWVMYHDTSRQCFTNEYYDEWLPVFFLSLSFYVIGVPCLLAYQLWKALKNQTVDSITFQIRYGVLTVPYRQGFYWFEIFNMGRKALIVVFVDFFFVMSTQFVQVFIMLFGFFVFLVFQTLWNPYKLRTNNTLSVSWILAAMYCLFTAVVFPNEDISDSEKDKFAAIVICVCITACVHSIIALTKEAGSVRYLKARNAFDMIVHLQFFHESREVLNMLFPKSAEYLSQVLPLHGIGPTRIFIKECQKFVKKIYNKSAEEDMFKEVESPRSNSKQYETGFIEQTNIVLCEPETSNE